METFIVHGSPRRSRSVAKQLLAPFVTRLTERAVSRLAELVRANCLLKHGLFPFFARGDSWREHARSGHCHPRLTIWQPLKRKTRSCLAGTFSTDARFLLLKRIIDKCHSEDSFIQGLMLKLQDSKSTFDSIMFITHYESKLIYRS